MVINRTVLSGVGAVAVVASLAAAVTLFLQHSHRATAGAPASAPVVVPVIVSIAGRQNVPVFVRGIGTVQA